MDFIVREIYGCGELDNIFCFFMRTTLQIQKSGIADLQVDYEAEEPIKSFMKISMELIICGELPETTDLILQAEYDYALKKYTLTVHQLLEMQLIMNISKHIHFDEDSFSYLLSTSNLWGNKANTYASKTFYGNLPLEIQRREGLDEIFSHIPSDVLELDNY